MKDYQDRKEKMERLNFQSQRQSNRISGGGWLLLALILIFSLIIHT